LLCLALFFQAAAQSPPPPRNNSSPYKGWDWQLINSSYYVYYPINEGTDFFLQFFRWFWEMTTTHIHMCNTCRVHFHLSETRYTLFYWLFNWKEHLTRYASRNFMLRDNSMKQAIIIMISIDSE
jgi:hypothetical protein